MITPDKIAELKALLTDVFHTDPWIEETANPMEEKDGPHLMIGGGIVGLWATEIEVEHKSIVGPKVTKQPGFVVESYAPVTYSRDHGADGGDPVDEENHPTWWGAVQDVVKRIAVHQADAFFGRLADLEHERQMEAEERAMAEYEGRVREDG